MSVFCKFNKSSAFGESNETEFEKLFMEQFFISMYQSMKLETASTWYNFLFGNNILLRYAEILA